jgi:hypothetical protein
LARRLKKSRAWVTQLLGGNANMTVRTLAEVVYALDAEVKLHARPLSWKIGGKPMSAGWQPAIFKMVDSPIVSERIFRLRTDQMKPTGEDLAAVKFEDPSRSQYAA